MSTVREVWGIQCPNCGHDDQLEVEYKAWASLLPNGAEPVGDHEWGNGSECYCRHCSWLGVVEDAKEETCR